MDTSKTADEFLAEVLQVIRPKIKLLPFTRLGDITKLPCELRGRRGVATLYPRLMNICGTLDMKSMVYRLHVVGFSGEETVITFCRRTDDEGEWYSWNTRFVNQNGAGLVGYSEITMITESSNFVFFKAHRQQIMAEVKQWFRLAAEQKEKAAEELRQFIHDKL